MGRHPQPFGRITEKMDNMFLSRICGSNSAVLPHEEDHPLLVAAKKELLGTDESTTLEQDLQILFKKIDLDDDEVLNLQEILIFFENVTEDVSMERITTVFQSMDENGDDSLDFAEFKNLFHQMTVAGWKKKPNLNLSDY